MKFHDLPKDAQHHALSTLRELIISGNRGEDEQALAGKVQAAFVSMYSDAGATTHTGTINVNFSNVPAGVSCIEKVAQAVTLRPSDGVSRVYHDTIVKCLKIEIEKLRSQIAVNEIVAY